MSRSFQPKYLYLNEDDDFESHGAAILLLVRNGVARDWKKLCRVLRFDRDPRKFHSGHLALKDTIDELITAGLLESKNTYIGPYKITDGALAVLHALGVSLTQAANMPFPTGLGIRPMFGKPTRLEKAAHAFVLMPLGQEMRPVYDGPIRAACRSARFSVERADDIFSTTDLVRDIWNAIVNAFVVIADCTGRNPNVFYELGIAHTLGKPTILITRSEEDVPADVRHIRYIKYSASPFGLQRLETGLRKTLKQLTDDIWSA